MLLFLETPLKNYCPRNFARLPSLDFANENFLVDKVFTFYGFGSTLAVTREQGIAALKGIQAFPVHNHRKLQ